MSNKFSIRGTASDLLHMCQSAAGFTESDVNAEEYLRYVLIEAHKKIGVFITANSLQKGIRVRGSDDIEVKAEGEVLVAVEHLIQILGTLSAETNVNLVYNAKEKRLIITDDHKFRARLGVIEITPKTVLPVVIEAEDEQGDMFGAVIDPEEFSVVFDRVSKSRSVEGRFLPHQGIHLAVAEDGDAHKFVMTATNSKIGFATDASRIVETISDISKLPEIVLNFDLTAPVMGLINEGDRVELVTYENKVSNGMVRDLFYRVWDKDENLLYFIRTNTISASGSDYSRPQLVSQIAPMVDESLFMFSIDREQFIGTLRQVSSIGMQEDSEIVNGQNKTVLIGIGDGQLSAFVRLDGKDICRNTVNIDLSPDEMYYFSLQFGIYGDVIRFFDGDTIYGRVLTHKKRKGLPVAIMLFNPEGEFAVTPEDGENKVGTDVQADNLPQYFSIVGLGTIDDEDKVMSDDE